MSEYEYKNLKIGDKVKLRDDLTPMKRYNDFLFTYGMDEIKGKIKIVTEITDYNIIFVNDDMHYAYIYDMLIKCYFKFGK